MEYLWAMGLQLKLAEDKANLRIAIKKVISREQRAVSDLEHTL